MFSFWSKPPAPRPEPDPDSLRYHQILDRLREVERRVFIEDFIRFGKISKDFVALDERVKDLEGRLAAIERWADIKTEKIDKDSLPSHQVVELEP